MEVAASHIRTTAVSIAASRGPRRVCLSIALLASWLAADPWIAAVFEDESRGNIVHLVVTLALALLLVLRSKRHRGTSPFPWLFGAALISASATSTLLAGGAAELRSVLFVVTWSVTFLMASLFSFASKEEIERLATYYGLAMTISIFVYVIHFSYIQSLYDVLSRTRILQSGPLNPNGVAFLIAGAVPFVMTTISSKLVQTIAAVMAGFSLYATGSRASLVALVVSGIIVAFVRCNSARKYFRVASTLAGIFTIIILIPQARDFVADNILKLEDPYRGIGTGFTGRTYAWSYALQLWWDRPIFGYGVRMSDDLYKESFLEVMSISSPHNGYLSMLVDMGLVGSSIYLAGLAWATARAFRGTRQNARVYGALLWFLLWYSIATVFERFAINVGNSSSILLLFTIFWMLGRRQEAASTDRLGRCKTALIAGVMAFVLPVSDEGEAASMAATRPQVFAAWIYRDVPNLSRCAIGSSLKVVYGKTIDPSGSAYSKLGQRHITNISKYVHNQMRTRSIVLDIEHWSKTDPGAYLDAIRKIRRALPGYEVGFYGVWPPRSYFAFQSSTRREQRSRWQRELEALRPVGEAVDVVYPSLYTFYDDFDGWARYAKGLIEAARQAEKPVVPFLWPQFHPGGRKELAYRFMSAEMWGRELRFVAERADGIVIWGGWDFTRNAPAKWDPKAPWWLETKRFLAELYGDPAILSCDE